MKKNLKIFIIISALILNKIKAEITNPQNQWVSDLEKIKYLSEQEFNSIKNKNLIILNENKKKFEENIIKKSNVLINIFDSVADISKTKRNADNNLLIDIFDIADISNPKRNADNLNFHMHKLEENLDKLLINFYRRKLINLNIIEEIIHELNNIYKITHNLRHTSIWRFSISKHFFKNTISDKLKKEIHKYLESTLELEKILKENNNNNNNNNNILLPIITPSPEAPNIFDKDLYPLKTDIYNSQEKLQNQEQSEKIQEQTVLEASGPEIMETTEEKFQMKL